LKIVECIYINSYSHRTSQATLAGNIQARTYIDINARSASIKQLNWFSRFPLRFWACCYSWPSSLDSAVCRGVWNDNFLFPLHRPSRRIIKGNSRKQGATWARVMMTCWWWCSCVCVLDVCHIRLTTQLTGVVVYTRICNIHVQVNTLSCPIVSKDMGEVSE